jgi:hypothetical protein
MKYALRYFTKETTPQICEGNWPTPIQQMIDIMVDNKDELFLHEQLLLTFVSIARLTSAIIQSEYIFSEEYNTVLNRCIANDLKRPTLGNFIKLLRTAAHQDEASQSISPLRKQLKELFSISGKFFYGQGHNMNLPDGWVAYRNSVHHGSRAILREEAMERNPFLVNALEMTLASLSCLKHSDFQLINGKWYFKGRGFNQYIVPITSYNHDSIEIMEGYNNSDQSIRYVNFDVIRNSKDEWSEWYNLLQKKSIFPIDWNQLNEDWLRNRVETLWSVRSTLTEEMALSIKNEKVKNDLINCIDKHYILTKDPVYTEAVYKHNFPDRYIFCLHPSDPEWRMGVYEAISSLTGVSASLGDLPQGHPVEQLISQMVILIHEAADEKMIRDWKQLELDFIGIKVYQLKKVNRSAVGMACPPVILEQLFSLITNDVQSIKNIDKQFLNSFEHLLFLYQQKEIIFFKLIGEQNLYKLYLNQLMDIPMEQQLVKGLAFISTQEEWSRNEMSREVWHFLYDFDFIKQGRNENYQWINHNLREAFFVHMLEKINKRMLISVVERIQEPISEYLAEHLYRLTRNQPLPNGKPCKIAVIAQQILHNESLKPSELVLPEVIAASKYLVQWGNISMVDKLLSKYHQFLKDGNEDLDSVTMLQLATALRNHGSAGSALTIYESIMRMDSPLSLRARHEAAGVLRDLEYGSKRAVHLYNEVLQNKLNLEQRVRALSSAAYNYCLLENYEEMNQYITMAVDLVKDKNDNHYLKSLVYHKLAQIAYEAGDPEMGRSAIEQALKYFGNRFTGIFGSRCLDTYCHILLKLGEPTQALHYIEIANQIRLSLGHRLGVQKGLILKSQILQRLADPDADRPAWEAYKKAKKAKDVIGEVFALERLANLYHNESEKYPRILKQLMEAKSRKEKLKK